MIARVLHRLYFEAVSRLRWLSYLFRSPIHPTNVRYDYQQNWIRFKFEPGMRVLDVGSGGNPFPKATLLADRFLEPTRHRSSLFQTDGKPVVISDIHTMPFASKAFDYVICTHVLEHVDDPIRACRELQRIAHAGYIETPTLAKDMLFSWAQGMHKWHLVRIASRLVFFEYSERQLRGMDSTSWRDLMFGATYHPLQKDFKENQDLWNVVFEWEEEFSVTVMYLDGAIVNDDDP